MPHAQWGVKVAAAREKEIYRAVISPSAVCRNDKENAPPGGAGGAGGSLYEAIKRS